MKRILTIALPVLLLAIVVLNFLPANSTETKTIAVSGMTCGSCETKVADAIQSINGVESVKVNHKTGTAEVTYNADHASLEKMQGAVVKAGFAVNGENAGKGCCASGSGCGDMKSEKSI